MSMRRAIDFHFAMGLQKGPMVYAQLLPKSSWAKNRLLTFGRLIA
jgi:hypothetical protein